MCTMYDVYSPDFGECKLELNVYKNEKILKLFSVDTLELYAVGGSTLMDTLDCALYEDDDFYYLTSYLCQPYRTVRVLKSSMKKCGDLNDK